jgi:hypothetical protein
LRENFDVDQESSRLCCGERRARCQPAQFKHSVPDIAVLGQMRRSPGFTAAGHHLIERAAMGELWVEVTAEFTRPAGACVKAIGNGSVDVFHEDLAPEGGLTNSPGLDADSS